MTLTQSAPLVRAFINRSYSWMAAGLVLTAAIAYITASHPALLFRVASLGWLLILAQLGIVTVFSFLSQRVNAVTAGALFLLYSALTGLTFSGLLATHASAAVMSFGVSALTFGAMSVYGMVTRRDLSPVGRFSFFAIVGLMLFMLLNSFVGSGALNTVIGGAGILVFSAVTAYDTQKLRQMALLGLQGEEAERGAIYGALQLYLDFINLFLFFLRLDRNS